MKQSQFDEITRRKKCDVAKVELSNVQIMILGIDRT